MSDVHCSIELLKTLSCPYLAFLTLKKHLTAPGWHFVSIYVATYLEVYP